MKFEKILSQYKLGNIELKNRAVMAPMTRSRAIGNIPNTLMAEYYRQRSGAGLIITEGVSPSPNGLGYARIPGAFSKEQKEGWKLVADAVHTEGGRIFMQIMHTGRISHINNMPEGASVLAPSPVKPAGQMWTDEGGLKDYDEPGEMTTEEVKKTVDEYVTTARNAVDAGFDGIEFHGANGYLIEQFLSPHTNRRTDEYGGSMENRCRFVLEAVDGVIGAIGKDKIGIRFSPYGVFNDMPHYEGIDEQYNYLAKELSRRGILYIHLVDHSSMGAPEVPSDIKNSIRKNFGGTLILSGGYTPERAEEELKKGNADLIAFAKPFINNPDLVERIANGWPLSKELDMDTFYTPGEKGYTDYPFYTK